MAETKTSLKVEGPLSRALRETANASRAVSTKPGKIDMKGAVQSAFAFAKEMFPEATDIRLEEVEPKSGGWSVVVSFATGQSNTFAIMRGEEGSRVYKTITIESESGQAKSLKVWK